MWDAAEEVWVVLEVPIPSLSLAVFTHRLASKLVSGLTTFQRLLLPSANLWPDEAHSNAACIRGLGDVTC